MNVNLIGVIGMVGAAGCVGVGSTLLKEREAEKDLSVDESDKESNDEQKLKENEKIVTAFPNDSMLIDKNKLKDILVQASYPAARVDEFVNLIATQAKVEAEKVVAEEIAPEPVKTVKPEKASKETKKPENKDGFVKVSFENLK